jgi:hypothetical protein
MATRSGKFLLGADHRTTALNTTLTAAADGVTATRQVVISAG